MEEAARAQDGLCRHAAGAGMDEAAGGGEGGTRRGDSVEPRSAVQEDWAER